MKWILSLCLALGAFTSTAHAADRYEMFEGSYQCGGYEDEVNAFLNYGSSGDLFPGGKYFYRRFEASPSAADAFCAAHADRLHENVTAGRCETTPVRVEVFADSRSVGFSFVCSALRNRLVQLGAALYAEFLRFEP